MHPKTLITLFLLFSPLCAACPEADPRCIQCGGDRCLQCIDSFSNTSGICIQIKNKIENCYTYKNENECMSCKSGYSANKDGICVLINIENCVKLDLNGDCFLCAEGNRAENGVCSSGGCDTEHCRFCSYYNEQEVCRVCKDNFVVYPREVEGVRSVECWHENGRSINCELARFNDFNECVRCRVNYYYANGKCVRSPDYSFEIERSFGRILGGFGLFLFVFEFIF